MKKNLGKSWWASNLSMLKPNQDSNFQDHKSNKKYFLLQKGPLGAENRTEYQWSLLIPMSGLGLVILQPGQFLDQNPLNPLNPVNIFVFDGTITKPI